MCLRMKQDLLKWLENKPLCARDAPSVGPHLNLATSAKFFLNAQQVYLTKVLNIDKFILHYFLKLENFRICSGKIMKKSYNWKWKVEGRDSIE